MTRDCAECRRLRARVNVLARIDWYAWREACQKLLEHQLAAHPKGSGEKEKTEGEGT